MKKNKKQIVITVSLIVILILAAIGVSYAAFSYVRRGEKVNQITTGTISMDYSESDNMISINNALPTTDETGKVRLRDGEYFDFSVTTNLSGDATINWEIAAEDFEDNTFDGENVKFYLTKLVGSEEVEVSSSLPAVYSEQSNENKKTGRPIGMMSLLTGSTSTQGEKTTNYRLRLYVDEAYNPQGDGRNLIFKTRINVYGKVSVEIEPIIRNWVGWDIEIHQETIDYNTFGQYLYRNKITSIETKRDTMIPTTAIEIENGKGNYWDESEAQNGSVISYLEDDESGNGTYKVTIGGKGKIIAPNSLINFFHLYGFNHLEKINLNSFDTSNVIDMSTMFQYCSATSIDLSGFDTSNVTSMSAMFSGCNSLTNLDLSSFDTSNVTNMAYMFSGCSSLTSIIASDKWKVSEITNTNGMFSNCGTDHVTVV